jgi:glycosyltransferase involved in cell wall biosynthesis
VPRIGIVVVAYNAASTLADVLNRIPSDFRGRIDAVYIGDDDSPDSTYLVGLGYQQAVGDLPLTVVRHQQNLGYGGNQKAGYRWAVEQGLDIVVLLHGDGQYAPELLPQIVAPLVRGECDAVFGSRMMKPRDALRGGMPLYKFAGNIVLTKIENAIAGEHLSEWHSGYRAYSVAALREIPFEGFSNAYDFDTEIIIGLHEADKRIVELPIPTFYGDEISYVNGFAYARQIVGDVLRYRAHKMGLGTGDLAFNTVHDDFHEDAARVHTRVLAGLSQRPPGRILDLGCGDGALGMRLRKLGHHVTGVDVVETEDVASRLDRFVRADLDRGIPDAAGSGYDVVLAVDVIGHLREPPAVLRAALERLAPGGTVMVSIPNFGHWYPRARVVLGRFDYDRRGILDRGHIRMFGRHGAERMFSRAGATVERVEPIGLPVAMLADRSAGGELGDGRVKRWLRRIDSAGVAVSPSLFAYEFLYELAPRPDD